MKCPKCNEPIATEHYYDWCTKCGEPLPEEIKSQLQTHLKSKSHSTIGAGPIYSSDKSGLSQTEPKGVGGWLAFLVFLLLAGTPLSSILGIVNIYIESQLAASLYQTKLFWDTTNVLLFVLPYAVIIPFSIYAGMAVIRLRPNAPNVLRAYLLTRIAVALLNLATASEAINSEKVIKHSIYAIVYSIIWLIYVAYSHRMENTFPQLGAQEESAETKQ